MQSTALLAQACKKSQNRAAQGSGLMTCQLSHLVDFVVIEVKSEK